MIDFKEDCLKLKKQMRKPYQKGGCMPFDTGALKRNTRGTFSRQETVFTLTIKDNGVIRGGKRVRYLEALENGSPDHDIPNAFGGGPLFGIGGRFNGHFHPGSTKWMGFIGDPNRPNSMVGAAIDYFVTKYDGTLKK